MTFQELVHRWVEANRPDLVFSPAWGSDTSAFINIDFPSLTPIALVDLNKIWIITTPSCVHAGHCPKWRSHSMHDPEIFNVLRDLKDCRNEFKDCWAD